MSLTEETLAVTGSPCCACLSLTTHAPKRVMKFLSFRAYIGENSRPQERQQRIIEYLRMRHIQPVRRTGHLHQFAVQHGSVRTQA